MNRRDELKLDVKAAEMDCAKADAELERLREVWKKSERVLVEAEGRALAAHEQWNACMNALVHFEESRHPVTKYAANMWRN
jgi:hypothetical protein